MIRALNVPQDCDKEQNHASKHLHDEVKHHIWATVLGYAYEHLLQWHWYLEHSNKEGDPISCPNQLQCKVGFQVDPTSIHFESS